MSKEEFGPTAKWRNNRLHRKCLFCAYLKLLPSIGPFVQDTWKCKCKCKLVNPDLPRPFCKCFILNKDRCDEIDKVFYEGLTPSEAKRNYRLGG